MPAGILPRGGWGQQAPPAGTPIDRGHPLAIGLEKAWLFNQSGGFTIHQPDGVISPRPAIVVVASSSMQWQPRGLFANNGYLDGGQCGSFATSGRSYTAMYFGIGGTGGQFGAGGNDHPILFLQNAGASFNEAIFLAFDKSVPKFRAVVGDGSGNTDVDGPTVSPAGSWLQGAVTWDDPAQTATVWGNGNPGTPTNIGRNPTWDTARSWLIGNSQAAQFGSAQNQLYGAIYAWRRVLSPSEIKSLYADPYQLFAPPVWRRYVIMPATAGQTALPVADVADGSWTNELGSQTDLYASLDETSASDADYIQSSDSPAVVDECKVRLGALSDPFSSSGHVVRYRYKKSAAGGHRIDLAVRLYASDGTTQIHEETHSDIGAITDGSFTLTGTEADSISSADYASGLILGFRAVKV